MFPHSHSQEILKGHGPCESKTMDTEIDSAASKTITLVPILMIQVPI